VDAFARERFAGNPAVMCLSTRLLLDSEMLNLAREFNVSETVFITSKNGDYSIRWFTPTVEVPLVGHATLAAAHVILTDIEPHRRSVTFSPSLGAPLVACRDGEEIGIELPADVTQVCPTPPFLIDGLGAEPLKTRIGRPYLAGFEFADQVRMLCPNFSALMKLSRPTIVVTAPGTDCDYVLRFFAPSNGVPEDPVSGVTQCSLVPYWAKCKGSTDLHSTQLSARGGRMRCELIGDKVLIRGRCQLIAREVLV
jgi:predicted PhzF superfamily epimerase YddE/YHI9